jgi:hypothetical protein
VREIIENAPLERDCNFRARPCGNLRRSRLPRWNAEAA